MSSASSPAQRLNPVFEVEGQGVLMATQFTAAVPERELRVRARSLAQQHDEISSALDGCFWAFDVCRWLKRATLQVLEIGAEKVVTCLRF